MNPLVYTAAQVAQMFPPELEVTEYWVNATARRHKVGTIIRRKRVFTLPQVQRLVDLQAQEAQQPNAARRERAKTDRQSAAKPKRERTPPAADSDVTPLQPRPDRARSYGGSAS
ncbi:hypothetical protein [Nonomuraea wenchangensis]|uniref:hypothetical protein n=1 Tax=Nonomuraea wenchangensis TaxID=568860 RepID=UPI0033246063